MINKSAAVLYGRKSNIKKKYLSIKAGYLRLGHLRRPNPMGKGGKNPISESCTAVPLVNFGVAGISRNGERLPLGGAFSAAGSMKSDR